MLAFRKDSLSMRGKFSLVDWCPKLHYPLHVGTSPLTTPSLFEAKFYLPSLFLSIFLAPLRLGEVNEGRGGRTGGGEKRKRREREREKILKRRK